MGTRETAVCDGKDGMERNRPLSLTPCIEQVACAHLLFLVRVAHFPCRSVKVVVMVAEIDIVALI